MLRSQVSPSVAPQTLHLNSDIGFLSASESYTDQGLGSLPFRGVSLRGLLPKQELREIPECVVGEEAAQGVFGAGAVVGHQVVSSEALHGALQVLVDEGRARQESRAGGEAVYEVTQRYANLVRAGLSRRVDALNHLGEALADTVMSRFFDENEVAFARTLTFSAPVDGVMALRKKVYDTVRLAASDLEDEAAETGSSGEKYSLVFAITPTQGGSLDT